jgi:hypothetical protein
MYKAYIENYIKYIHIAPFCSKPRAVENRRTYRIVGQKLTRPDVRSNFSVTWDRQNA